MNREALILALEKQVVENSELYPLLQITGTIRETVLSFSEVQLEVLRAACDIDYGVGYNAGYETRCRR